MGSKNKIAKSIVPIIQDNIKKYNIKTYIEPFCGGCNIIDKIKCDIKIASDNQKYLIALLQNLDKIHNMPEFIDKKHYCEVRECFKTNSNIFTDWYIGAVGFLASYNGRFFDGGYSGLVQSKDGSYRNYYDEAKRNLISQIPLLENIKFNCVDYEYYSDYKDCLFYLDLPYYGTKQYISSENFNHKHFWDWCEFMSDENIVLISEYKAPDSFECIWQQEVNNNINHKKVCEKLFWIK